MGLEEEILIDYKKKKKKPSENVYISIKSYVLMVRQRYEELDAER